MEQRAILEQINRFPYWYHRIELPFDVTTPGWAPISPGAYRIPSSLQGRRVLDVGAWDGYWTFEALRRGAYQAVAIDDFSDYLGILSKEQRYAWDTFDTCRSILGFSESQAPRFDISVYDLTPSQFGMFDTIFFFGTLYHLRHPLLALDRLSALCKPGGEIYVESAILDDFSPYRNGFGHGYPDDQMVMEFYPDAEYASNDSNWWVPTLACMAHMVRSARFEQVEGWKLEQRPQHLSQCRGFVKGIRKNDQ